MNSAWQAQSGRLACRWSGLFEHAQYNPSWLQAPESRVHDNAVVPVPDFAAHSPLGSGEWFVPWNLRWSVPTRFVI
jgi:hypothetical protein